jgi:hypothetical protein
VTATQVPLNRRSQPTCFPMARGHVAVADAEGEGEGVSALEGEADAEGEGDGTLIPRPLNNAAHISWVPASSPIGDW